MGTRMDNTNRAHTDPTAAIRAIESSARQFETPCGTGRMVWRSWGEGQPILLLHGGSGSWLHWLTTIPVLAPQYTVWVPDMPGFGDSDLPPEPYALETYTAVLESGLRSLLPESVALDVVGFSLGASVAVRLACLLDGRFRYLVLSGANFFPPIPGKRLKLASLKRMEDPAERVCALRHNLQVMMLAHEQNIDPLALHLYSLDTARRKLPRVSFSGFQPLRTDLPHARVGRLTVISGADDQVIGHGKDAQAEALRALRPDAQYQALDGGGHWVMYEVAERYNEALLRALGAAGATER
jgi:2-hydroxy-6-oxonona-2,4-dienedioate hydrolase